MIYLDNAATTHPKPESVYRAMDRFSREVGANPGRGGHRLAVQAEAEVALTRRQVAALLGAPDPSRVIFTLNATDALNMVFKGLLRSGDHVVTTVMEHNSVARPLNRMERDGWITVTRLAPSQAGSLDPEAVGSAIGPATRLVVVSHALNVTGAVLPVAEIGQVVSRTPALLVVDAAQSAGLVPIDLSRDPIDLLVFSGHKGLLGPTGTGGVHVGPRASPTPWREGGTGGDSSHPVQPSEYPHLLEAGTPNAVGIAGLGEGVRYVASKTPEALLAHEVDLAARLWGALADDSRFVLYGPPPGSGLPRTGVVSLNVRDLPASEVGAILDSTFEIAVRAGLHCAPGAHRHLGSFPEGTIRVAPGAFSRADEIDALVSALAEIAA